MIFTYNHKNYRAATATEIIRAIEKDAANYPDEGASMRKFLNWSLDQFVDQIHHRELENTAHVSDEVLAFNYLCLLDEYRIGSLSETKNK